MRKTRHFSPPEAASPSSRATSSLECSFPSMHRAATAAPWGSFARMVSASFARARPISAREGESGRRCSGSSIISSLQKRLNRLAYSAAASM